MLGNDSQLKNMTFTNKTSIYIPPDTKIIANRVRNYYDSKFDSLKSAKEKFHYASRMFLWFKQEADYQRLKILEDEIIGYQKSKTNKIFREINSKKTSLNKIRVNKIRKPFLRKHPFLLKHLPMLFLVLHAKNIYGKNIKNISQEFLNEACLRNNYQRLILDKKAIATLSTYVINFFYLTYFYTKDKSLRPQVDKLANIAKPLLLNKRQPYFLKLGIYLITRCIIGETFFYSRNITENRRKYREALSKVERSIKNNFSLISLDNKLEFLVCCRILNQKSQIETAIYEEINNSLSSRGDFIEDRLNNCRTANGNSFNQSEHRNVLFLMSLAPYQPKKSRPNNKTKQISFPN